MNLNYVLTVKCSHELVDLLSDMKPLVSWMRWWSVKLCLDGSCAQSRVSK